MLVTYTLIIIICAVDSVLLLVGVSETINLWRKFPKTLWKTPLSRFIFLYPPFNRQWNKPQEQLEYLVQNRYLQSFYFIISMLLRYPGFLLYFVYPSTVTGDLINAENFHNQSQSLQTFTKTAMITTILTSYFSDITIFLVLHNMATLLTSVWFKRFIMCYLVNAFVIVMTIGNIVFIDYAQGDLYMIQDYDSKVNEGYKYLMFVCSIFKVILTFVIAWRLSRKLLLSPTYKSQLGKYLAVFRFWFFVIGLFCTEFA